MKELRDILQSFKEEKIGKETAENEILYLFQKKHSKMLGLEDPYPLSDVLDRLKWATEYLLHKKDYDGHCYEELNQCVKRAEEILSELKKEQ